MIVRVVALLLAGFGPGLVTAAPLTRSEAMAEASFLDGWYAYLLAIRNGYVDEGNASGYVEPTPACLNLTTTYNSLRTDIGCAGNSSWTCPQTAPPFNQRNACCKDGRWVGDYNDEWAQELLGGKRACTGCDSTSSPFYAPKCTIDDFVRLSVCYTEENDEGFVPLPAGWQCSKAPSHAIDGTWEDAFSVSQPAVDCGQLEADYGVVPPAEIAKRLANWTTKNYDDYYYRMSNAMQFLNDVAIANGTITFKESVKCIVVVKAQVNGALKARQLTSDAKLQLIDAIVYQNSMNTVMGGGEHINVIGGRNEGTVDFERDASVTVYKFNNMGVVAFYNCTRKVAVFEVTNNATVTISNSTATVWNTLNSGDINFIAGTHSVIDTNNSGAITFVEPVVSLDKVRNTGSISMTGGNYTMDSVVNSANVAMTSGRYSLSTTHNTGDIEMTGGSYSLVSTFNSGEIKMSGGSYVMNTMNNLGNVSMLGATNFYLNGGNNIRNFINLTTNGNVTIDYIRNSGVVHFHSSQKLTVTNTDNLVQGVIHFYGVRGSLYNVSNVGKVIVHDGYITADTIYNSGDILIKKEVTGTLKVICNEGNITLENGISGVTLLAPTGVTGINVPASGVTVQYFPPTGECVSTTKGIRATFYNITYSGLSSSDQQRFRDEFKACINFATNTPLSDIIIGSVVDGSIIVDATVARPSRQQSVAFTDTVSKVPEIIFTEENGFSVSDFGSPFVQPSDTEVQIQINTVSAKDATADAFSPAKNDVALFVVVICCAAAAMAPIAYLSDAAFAAADPDGTMEINFWRNMNTVHVLRGSPTRNIKDYKYLVKWGMRRNHPWFMCSRPKGDYMTTRKRLLLLLVLLVNMATVAFLLAGTDQKLPGLSDSVAAGLVACILSFPVPYVFGVLYSRNTPPTFQIQHMQNEGLYSKVVSFFISWCPVCMCPNLEMNLEEEVEHDYGEKKDVGEEKGVGDEKAVVKEKGVEETLSHSATKNLIDVHFDSRSRLVGNQQSAKMTRGAGISSNHAWTARDTVGLSVTLCVVVGCSVLMCMLSWRYKETRAEALASIFAAMIQDFILRFVAIVGVEAVFVAPCCCCCLICASASASRGRTSSKVAMKELGGQNNEQRCVELPLDVPLFAVNDSTLVVERVESAGKRLGVRMGTRLVSLDGKELSNKRDMMRALQYMHATKDAAVFGFVAVGAKTAIKSDREKAATKPGKKSNRAAWT